MSDEHDYAAPNITLPQWLVDGSNPSAGYCRICAQFAIPRFEGHYAVGVCGEACFDEFRWREALRTSRRPYHRPNDDFGCPEA